MPDRVAKRPQQARGQARVDRLLDAAAAIIARRGVDGLTMAAVGDASGSAPGSVYQFFPNRESLVEALAKREADKLERCVATAMARWRSAERHDPATLIGLLLDPLLDFYLAHPVWGELLHALARRGEPGPVEAALDRAVLTHLREGLTLLAPAARATATDLAARVLLELGHPGLMAAQNNPPIYAEVCRCLIAYLEAWQHSVG